MRTPLLWSVTRFMTLLLVLCPGVRVTAQSAADQAIKTLPQQLKDNGENRVVTKSNNISNNVSNNAMNKLDSASNKALKGFTGIFKKKNKKKAADSTAVHAPDSTAVHAPDSTAAPKTSSFIRSRPIPNDLLRPLGNPVLDQKKHYFKNTIIETYQS